jgi:hypothetical protein
MRRLIIIGLGAAVLVSLVAVPALGAEEGGESEGPAVTTTTSGAAVDLPPEDAEAEEQPWTARFIYPGLIALTALSIVVIVIYWLLAIKNKYHVVES